MKKIHSWGKNNSPKGIGIMSIAIHANSVPGHLWDSFWNICVKNSGKTVVAGAWISDEGELEWI